MSEYKGAEYKGVEYKVCRTCKEAKPLSDFYLTSFKRLANGPGKKYKPDCKECHKARVRADYRVYTTVERSCRTCGEYKPASEFVLKSNWCLACKRQYNKAMYDNKMHEYREKYKSRKGKDEDFSGLASPLQVPGVERMPAGQYGSFYWNTYYAVCSCGERFAPVARDFRFPRRCWHIDRGSCVI